MRRNKFTKNEAKGDLSSSKQINQLKIIFRNSHDQYGEWCLSCPFSAFKSFVKFCINQTRKNYGFHGWFSRNKVLRMLSLLVYFHLLFTFVKFETFIR